MTISEGRSLHAVAIVSREEITSPHGRVHGEESIWWHPKWDGGWLLMEGGVIYGVVRRRGRSGFELVFALPEGHVSEPMIGYTAREACADAIVRLQSNAKVERQ